MLTAIELLTYYTLSLIHKISNIYVRLIYCSRTADIIFC